MNIFNVSETGFYPKTLNPVQNFLYSCVGVGETPIGIFPSLNFFFGCFVDLRSSTVLGLRQWARWNKEMWLWLLWMRMSWLEACKFMQIRRNNSSLVPSFNQQCRLGVEKRNNIKKVQQQDQAEPDTVKMKNFSFLRFHILVLSQSNSQQSPSLDNSNFIGNKLWEILQFWNRSFIRIKSKLFAISPSFIPHFSPFLVSRIFESFHFLKSSIRTIHRAKTNSEAIAGMLNVQIRKFIPPSCLNIKKKIEREWKTSNERRFEYFFELSKYLHWIHIANLFAFEVFRSKVNFFLIHTRWNNFYSIFCFSLAQSLPRSLPSNLPWQDLIQINLKYYQRVRQLR